VKSESFVPGGAANAASNVSSLAGSAHLVGIVGNDSSRDILLEESKKRGIDVKGVLTHLSKPTIQKMRVLGQNQQLMRIDYENREYIEGNVNIELLESINENNHIDCIIVSDYAKGTINKELLHGIKKHAKDNKIPILVDPKPKHKSWYIDVDGVTPNTIEAEELSGISINNKSDLEKAGTIIMNELKCNVLITTGEKGMSLFEKNKKPIHIPTQAKEVFDVSGAGDTVIATMALALSSGASLFECASLANYAAGIKVGKVGTASVSLQELERSLDE